MFSFLMRHEMFNIKMKTLERIVPQIKCLCTTRLLCYKKHNTKCKDSLSLEELPNSVGYNGLQQDVEYLLTYKDLIRDLTKSGNSQILNETKQRVANAIKHTIPCGRQFEGLGVIDTYKLIESSENLTPKNIQLARILSWATALQCIVNMLPDDIMDREQSRKRLPCWYQLKDIGLTAVSDSWLVQGAVLEILKKYFSDHACYIPILKLFHTTVYKVGLGQAVDLACMTNGTPNFKAFTRKRLSYLGEYKSASFCYEFPLKLALYLAGNCDSELHKRATNITSKIGFIFMAHNDMQDAFGNPDVVGKGSTDIRNGKCCWPSVEALHQASPSQRKVFEEHYGKPCSKSEQMIHNLYRELKLWEIYQDTERSIINEINEEADKISSQIPKQVFSNFLTDVTLYRKGYCTN